MQETRQNRISRLLQKELATIFQSQTRMMHGVMVSVTRVRVSPDLSICTAYLSIFQSDKGEEMLKISCALSPNCVSSLTTVLTI